MAAWALAFTGVGAIAEDRQTEPPSDVRSVCERVANRLASVAVSDCAGPGYALTGASSVNGTPLFAKVYPPLPTRAPQARILLIGGIHGDELTSVSIVFKWMRILNKHHSGLFHWELVPALNPDGLLRKKSLRLNANGVDLNRNFPTPDWAQRAINDYWITRTHKNPRRYPGQTPLSEPESRWLAEEIERFRPHAIVAVHAPYGVVDFDGPPEGPQRLGHLHLNLLGTYPGSLGNYAGTQKNIPVVTIELPYAGIMPSDQQVRRIWTDLVRWLIGNIPRKNSPPLYADTQAGPS